ncbi:type I-E CRISPR-associated protein Cse2/CasB [Actinoplanes teichomyceticus]|uniref:CRISPR-associated Cse2 family protein n=1 Tax=Actinoplanes teichomyceticus TaxID=1867 RepID=A0A561VSA6_ACTTI|nr:type I-E CRISPR-associated protein Cse2/CasB [Actinoplanes teichomyceticus]TWG14483.1 CRISPR-associated Cse2 family protein [Actinoplanes teichomyceticus]GIF16287.1 hypothetical protein Ate01nite_63190 [Actinoplanes teichomyceticus]
MTAEATSPPPTAGGRRPPARRRQPFGNHVAATTADLQTRLLQSRESSAVATMARLRAAATKPPGADYTVLTVTRVPDRFHQFPPGDEPTRQEWAKHTALTLYAGHQQSVSAPMHVDGIGLGAAVSSLARKADSPEAVRRRFSALGSAMTYDTVIYHVRGLVTLLKQHRIPLDYGALADDLVQLQWPDGRDRVRAQWGREFYRTFTAQPTSDDSQE